MKIICSSIDALPESLPAGSRAFTFLEPSSQSDVGRIAYGWHRELENAGYAPSVPVWDFVLFCFAIYAADVAVLRKGRGGPDQLDRKPGFISDISTGF